MWGVTPPPSVKQPGAIVGCKSWLLRAWSFQCQDRIVTNILLFVLASALHRSFQTTFPIQQKWMPATLSPTLSQITLLTNWPRLNLPNENLKNTFSQRLTVLITFILLLSRHTMTFTSWSLKIRSPDGWRVFTSTLNWTIIIVRVTHLQFNQCHCSFLIDNNVLSNFFNILVVIIRRAQRSIHVDWLTLEIVSLIYCWIRIQRVSKDVETSCENYWND